MAVEPDINDPDWDRYLVSAQHGIAPAGNPVRWGGVAITQLTQANVGPDEFNVVSYVTPPIVNVVAADTYGRGWSIVGTLKMPRSSFYAVYFNNPTTPTAGGYPAPLINTRNVVLELVIGLGQVSFLQRILLMAAGQPELGLCNTQSAVNGGPYAELYTREENGSPEPWITRSFAAVSSFVGNMVSVRGVYELGGMGARVNMPATLSLGMSPLAAGTKL